MCLCLSVTWSKTINSTSPVSGQTRLAVNVSKEKSHSELLMPNPGAAYNKAKFSNVCVCVWTLDNRILQGESQCTMRAGAVRAGAKGMLHETARVAAFRARYPLFTHISAQSFLHLSQQCKNSGQIIKIALKYARIIKNMNPIIPHMAGATIVRRTGPVRETHEVRQVTLLLRNLQCHCQYGATLCEWEPVSRARQEDDQRGKLRAAE